MRSHHWRVVVLALTAGLFVPATSAAMPAISRQDAKPTLRNARAGCPRTYTIAMFRRAARATYAGYRTPTKADIAHLRKYKHCARHVWARPVDTRTWAINRKRHRARIDALTPYGRWAIPGAIVWCESNDRNLPPNSASASGWYQVTSGTWAGYGGQAYAPQAYEASKIDQDIVVGRIWREGGPSQWVCAGLTGY